MKISFLFFGALLLSLPPTLAAPNSQTPRLRTLKAAKPERYSLNLTYPQWRPSTPTLRAANYFYRQKTYARFFHLRGVSAKLDSELPRDFKPAAGPSYYNWKPEIALQNPDLLSGLFFADFFDGGMHPNTETFPVNVGLVKGKPQLLSIYDLCLPGKTRAVAAKVFKALRRVDKAEWVKDRTKMLLVDSPALTKTFVITPTGLLFIFDPYIASSYSAGEIRVKIPFSELKAELDPNGPLRVLL